MGKSLNQVTLLGNLTKDPELRTTPNGMSVCSFSLALNRSYKVNDQWTEAVDYVDVVAWANLAERVSGNTSKGNALLVTGRLQNRKYEKDGTTHNKVEVVAQDVTFINRATGLNSMPHEEQSHEKPYEKKDVVLKDIDENFDMSSIPF